MRFRRGGGGGGAGGGGEPRGWGLGGGGAVLQPMLALLIVGVGGVCSGKGLTSRDAMLRVCILQEGVMGGDPRARGVGSDGKGCRGDRFTGDEKRRRYEERGGKI